MNRIGISHNDIHFGNVIVTPRTGKLFSSFTADNGQVYDISPYGTMYNCKIYDFDRASSIIGKNMALEDTGACRSVGQCNRMDSQKDVFNVLMLIHLGRSDEVMDSFKNILWSEMFVVNPTASSALERVVLRNTQANSF